MLFLNLLLQTGIPPGIDDPPLMNAGHDLSHLSEILTGVFLAVALVAYLVVIIKKQKKEYQNRKRFL